MTGDAGDTSRTPEMVLLEAVDRVCHSLKIADDHLPFVVETALQQGAYPDDTGEKRLLSIATEDGLLIVRLYLYLTTQMGSDAAARDWLTSFNAVLNARRITLLSSHSGLVRVVSYLASTA